ncbi:hypothetical protein [Thomasclavelia sp.]|uniref:glycosyltransferase family 2 protein n=1 Tax=Thomasclavelia sp. TaxID=3025757 RepID=UPI0025FA9AF2|nr:hypothetical protein [Thomasclavelia sp.]
MIKQGLKYYGDIFNYILISNPDIYLENPLTLSKLKMILYNKKNCAVIGPKVIKGKEIQGPYKEQKLFNYILYYLFPFISVPYRKIISTKTKYRSQEGYVWRIIGAFMLIDFQTFKKVGFFDEHTFLYWEEEILSYKLNRIGQQVYYYPNISIKHYHGGGSESKFISNHSLDSMEYYFKLKGYSCLGINCAKKIIKYYNYLIKIYYNTVNRMRRNKSNEI